MTALDLSAGLPDTSVTVSEFVDLLNETYEFAFPSILISGELANLRVSKNKWVYFDLKDNTASVKFFGTVYNLPGPLEEGMMLQVRGVPHMHELYGFSVNIQLIQVAGEGSIRRAAELLTAKLQAEGLFDDSRKRTVPYPPQHIGLITSGQSAAYADFVKIVNARWAGITIDFIDVQVQGEVSPHQIVGAINRFNSLADPPEVLVLIRGGGSADDMAGFSTEQVTRAVAASRIPTLIAIGHEIDISLAELAADKRASTPSNAAELLVPDKRVVMQTLAVASESLFDAAQDILYAARTAQDQYITGLSLAVQTTLNNRHERLEAARSLLAVLDPAAVLRRGYAVVRLESTGASSRLQLPAEGDSISIQLDEADLMATVTSVMHHTANKNRKLS